jgi:hypothetical protein
MHGNSAQPDICVNPRTGGALLRGFIEGAAGLLNIFGAKAAKPGTPEDDALALMGDVEELARDFHAVLPTIEARARQR